MKWIGQHIYDLVSRFRNDVYLEDISTGTIASGGNLGLDSNNKIVKANEAAGDITGVEAGTGLSGGGTSGSVILNVDASQTQITAVGTIGTGVWNGTAIASAYLDSDTAHLTTNQTFSGVKTFSDVLILDGDRNYGGEGGLLHLDTSTLTDITTSASGTLSQYRTVNIEPMFLAATNAGVTTTDAASIRISGAPAAGTNMTITNTWALWASGNVRLDNGLKLDDVLLSSVQTSSESFADNDTSIMTSGAIKDTLYSTSYITFSVKSSSTYGTNYILLHGNGISGGLVNVDSGTDSAGDFGGVTTEEGGSGTDATCNVGTATLEQQIPIPETCKLMGFHATASTTTNTGAAYDIGVAIWHVPEANVNWGASTAGEATLIHKSDSSRHAENTAHGGANKKKVQKVTRMDGTAKTLAAGDILVPSLFGETSGQQVLATITLVIATPIKTI